MDNMNDLRDQTQDIISEIEQENQQDTQAQPMPDQEVAQATQQDSDKEKNFRKLRERAEKLERERDEAMNYIREIGQQQLRSKQVDNVEPENYEDDSLITRKQLRAYEDKIKNLENRFTQESAQSRLKSQYQDFDKVVTPDNLSLLRDLEPEWAASINANPDLYSKAVTAYKAIKKLNIARDEGDEFNKLAIERNIKKPQPSAAVTPQRGDTPFSQVNKFQDGMTPELKKSLWKEMEEARRRY